MNVHDAAAQVARNTEIRQVEIFDLHIHLGGEQAAHASPTQQRDDRQGVIRERLARHE